MLLRARAVAIAAACIGGDEQLLSLAIGTLTHHIPPASNGDDRKGGRVVVAIHIHPRSASPHVVDSAPSVASPDQRFDSALARSA